MSELQTLESIIKQAPDDMWTHCNDIDYFRHIKQHSWLIYNDVSGCWQEMETTGIIHEKNIRNRKDIQKQIDQLKEIDNLKSLIGAVVNSRGGDINTVDESLATVGLDELIHLESYFQGNG